MKVITQLNKIVMIVLSLVHHVLSQKIQHYLLQEQQQVLHVEIVQKVIVLIQIHNYVNLIVQNVHQEQQVIQQMEFVSKYQIFVQQDNMNLLQTQLLLLQELNVINVFKIIN